MSGVLINVHIDDKEVRTLLTGIQSRLGNLKPAMKIIGEIVLRSVKNNFRQGGRPEKWKALSPATLKKKRANTPLIDTKRLMNSLTYKAHADRVEVGTNVIYGAIHQFGGPAGRGRKVNIPARPYLMVQDEDWINIKETLTDYLIRKGA